MVDYVLNVAVGISAGVGALISAVPALHAYTLPLCLGILVLLTFVNLRGTMDSGRLFALPTYLLVACFMIVLLLGAYSVMTSGVHPQPVVPPPRRRPKPWRRSACGCCCVRLPAAARR